MLLGNFAVAQAGQVAIQVPDASQLLVQTSSDGKIYLRNINSFDPQALGCCYNYYIDTTTAEGKNIFVIWLSSVARASRIIFFLPDNYAAGAVTFAGNY
jgi:hypothetical protein